MDGTCVRDYVHVSDLAAAHVSALVATRKANPGHASALNLGTGSGQSVLQVLDTVRILTGHPVPHEFAPRRPGDPPVLVAQSSARTVLQWTPSRSSLLNIVESTCRWQRQHTHHVHSGQPTEGIPSEASPAC
jgi:UDP-glucose 4-epimerase